MTAVQNIIQYLLVIPLSLDLIKNFWLEIKIALQQNCKKNFLHQIKDN